VAPSHPPTPAPTAPSRTPADGGQAVSIAELRRELEAIVGPDGVLTDDASLLVYAADGFPIARGRPRAVVFPRSTEQVRRCVVALRRRGVPITPRGSGTGLTGGCVAFGEGVIISTTRMTAIESIDVANRVAVVQAGVRNGELSDAVEGFGLHFSPDPSSQRASTIGGNAATNAGGIGTLKHGVTTRHVLGLEVVTPDGETALLRGGPLHDGVGPDLVGLWCGSEGVLGLITRVWCRLAVRPAGFRTVYAEFDSLTDACQTVASVIAAGQTPTSMEMIDGPMIRVVEEAFGFGFSRDAEALLLIEIDGVDAVLDEQLEEVLAIAHRHAASRIEHCREAAERARLWKVRKSAFGAIGRISRSYCTQDACVPRSKLPEVVATVTVLGREHGFAICNVFHAGDGNVHPIMLFDEDDPEQVQRVLHLSEAILEYCVSVGGVITGEHGVGVEKLHLMPAMFSRATLDRFRAIKEAIDPAWAINDGKLLPSPKTEIELLRPAAVGTPGGAL